MARAKKSDTGAVKSAEAIAKSRGYEEIGGGEIIAWQKGMVAEFEIIKLRSLGKNKGNLMDVRENDERKTYGCPTILWNRIHELDKPEGAEVIVECLGKIKTENGDAWNFRLFAAK